MIGEPPEWMLWTMFGLMAFIMLIPLLKALAPLPLPRSRPRGRIHLGGKGSRAGSGRIFASMPFNGLNTRRQRVAIGVDAS
jgi:hypothetical protein